MLIFLAKDLHFAGHLMEFCDDSKLIISSKSLQSEDSYTYISEAWHTTSWFDHCISTCDAHNSLSYFEIMHDLSMSDHIPFMMTIDADSLPEIA